MGYWRGRGGGQNFACTVVESELLDSMTNPDGSPSALAVLMDQVKLSFYWPNFIGQIFASYGSPSGLAVLMDRARPPPRPLHGQTVPQPPPSLSPPPADTNAPNIFL